MNKICLRFSTIAAAALLAGSHQIAAQPQDVSVELVRIFDYPTSTGYIFDGTGQINDQGIFVLLVGQDLTEAGALGRANGGFSQPFSVPDATGYTFALGINNRGLVCGFYLSDKFHGFFRNGNGTNFRTYDAPLRNASTIVESVNDAGNFAGQAGGGVATAFTVIDRTFIPITSLNQATASGINNLDEVVGSYAEDTGEAYHGFFRAADGTLTMPIDFPGALRTMPRAINDSGYIGGSWAAGDFDHGFVIRLPDTFISYDVPGAIVTFITGINNSGQICGYFQDQDFVGHGFIAQLVEQ